MAGINENYPAQHPKIAWQDGKIVPWDDCVVHVRTQAGFFGANIFEGLRAYWNSDSKTLFLFRLEDHLKRLKQSMKIMRMQSPYSLDNLREATIDLFTRCDFKEHGQANIVVCFGYPAPGDPLSPNATVGAHITAVPMARSPKTGTGVTAAISSWRRLSDDTMPIRIKIGSNYQNGRLAQNQVSSAGFDMALLQNRSGKISEAPGACVFMVREGVLITPPLNADILESITRDTIIIIAKERLGMEVVEREVDRSEIYLAEEVFICGSIAEVLPIISIDGIAIAAGKMGPVTMSLQHAYFDIVEGKSDAYRSWCTPIKAVEIALAEQPEKQPIVFDGVRL